ncbi:SH3 domain-containing protein [Paraclostridium sordellii]|uniref:SH3-domain-containing protein n=1 Tax=Paraclostridium sordellii TaxID=1505 RepID=A0A9P1P8Q7_PARSO|nr:SH3 domain-containing protein [Paeniclostridium sordellii]CEO32735.1 SH3-domain-containing protein [[Clostridium] sordellii] [Paeniclostridium sordellii]
MKKPKKFMVITAVSLSLIGGVGAYAGLNNKAQANQPQEINQSINTIKVEKGDIKTVVEAGGKASLSDENNPNSITITLSANQYDVSKLQVNQSVEIKSKAFPDEIVNGTITEVANKANEGDSPTYTVKVEVSKPILELGEITYSEVSVKKGPSKEYGNITKLEKENKVKILEKKNNWIKIRMEDNSEGWVPKDSVKTNGLEQENIESKISKNDVNIRNSNSSGSKSLGKLVQGEKVKIIDKKDNWYKVVVNDELTGWVQESDLALQKLKDGMSVTGTILVSEKKDILKVPVAAVQKDEKGYYVTMANTNEKRYVEVGESDSESIEVTKGLLENDNITMQSFVAPAQKENSGSKTDTAIE